MALVRPLMEYSNAIWDISTGKEKQIEQVQSRAAKFVIEGKWLKTESKRRLISELTQVELKDELKKRKGVKTGNKPQLVNRLGQMAIEEGEEIGWVTVKSYNYRSVTETVKKLNWDALSKRRKAARLVAIYKAHRGDKAWKDIKDRFETPYFKGRNDHYNKIMVKAFGRRLKNRNSLVDKGIAEWNGLPEKVFENRPPVKLFRKRVLELS